MRVFPLLLTLALTIECAAGSLVARFIMRSMSDSHQSAPMFTDWFFSHPFLWLLIPLPWLISALVLWWRTPSAQILFVYAGVTACAAALLGGVMLIAAILPLLRFKA